MLVDREKKTAKESPATKPTSLLNRERTQEFVSKQQMLRLRGMRLMDSKFGQLVPAPSTYLTRAESMPVKSLEEFYRFITFLVACYHGRVRANSNKMSNLFQATCQFI